MRFFLFLIVGALLGFSKSILYAQGTDTIHGDVPLFDSDFLTSNTSSNKKSGIAQENSLFDPEFRNIREQAARRKNPSFDESQKDVASKPKSSVSNPSTTSSAAAAPDSSLKRTVSQPSQEKKSPAPSLSNLTHNQKPRKVTKTSQTTARDPKEMYDPKDLHEDLYMGENPRVVIKEDMREGRIYVTLGIGGVLGSTSSGSIARVDKDAFSNVSAASYHGNSLTARFGRVDSDIALVGMAGVGYDSSISDRGLGYSIGLEYLYQDKSLTQHYTTHDNFGNQVTSGEISVGEIHYIMAKFLGKYRINSWMPYVGIGGGMALYKTRDLVSSALHLPIFGNGTHAAPVIMPVVGLEYDLNQDWSITGEYKYLYCPTARFNEGVKAEFKPLDTHNLIIGAKYGF
ncbi:MAG: outer membrane beta-barrel protein [Verrucomicrobiae bacterium]|nr:outer membrane beta-barrel protein [Verrucomicrobiae bacterium]